MSRSPIHDRSISLTGTSDSGPSADRNSEHRGWIVALGIAVVAHAALLTSLVIVRTGRATGDQVRDVPIMRGVLGDTSGISGTGPEPSGASIGVQCTYVFDARNELARLSSGPPWSEGRLGCRDSLKVSAGLVPEGVVTVTYRSDGQIIGINDGRIDPSSALGVLVRSWDLATPRRGRQWPGEPTVTLRLRK
jgi:hypothetical protein